MRRASTTHGTRTLIALLGLATAPASAAVFNVASANDIANAMNTAQPGDVLVMADGVWTNQSIDFEGFGTAGNPITLRAQTPGGVTLTGQSNLSISGDYLVVDGLNFENGTPGGESHVVQFRGSNGHATNSRLTNTQIKNYNPSDINDRYFWVSLYGQNNRVDHSRFENQNHSGVTVVAWLDGGTAGHQIDNNHFLDRPEGNGNGFETIRLGTSTYNATDAQILVENNLFERTDGEIEIISNKSTNNTFRYNTFRESAGTLTLRHGGGATVEGNFFLGENKDRSGGIRVIGEDHLIINNYIADVDDRAEGAISISAGVPNTPDNGYEQVLNATIANNTIVNTQGPAITLDAGLGSSGRTLLANDVTIANNLILSTNDALFEGQEGTGWTWQNNIAFGNTLGPKAGDPGITVVDPMLVLDADGLWRPASNSPAIDGGTAVPAVTTDMDGQPRIGVIDIGADEFSTAQIVRAPLTAADVGPVWDGTDPTDPPTPSNDPLVILARDFSAITDPDNDGDVWTVVSEPAAFGGEVIEAPAGSRTNLPGTHETLAVYDVVFEDADDYTVYYRARGFSGSTDSFFAPDAPDIDPDNTESTSNNGAFRWETGATFTIDSAHAGLPLEFRIGRREGLTQLDAIVFNTQPGLSDAQLDALVQAALTTPPIPGDADGDGDIDDTDLGIAISNFTGPIGAAGNKTAPQGDTDTDGDVDDTDLGVAISGFTGPLPPTTVPEPASLVLLSIGALLASRRRCRWLG